MVRGPVRLERRVITLPDGHRVGVAMGGRGMPFVLVHGFGTEARVYSESLTRIAALGFRVVAIDAAGHGSTPRPHAHHAGAACARALGDAGLDSKRATIEDVERACYVPGARVLTLNRHADHTRLRKGGTPLYRWRRSTPHPSSVA